MKIAVTGGSGQLGTLVLRRLAADRRVKEIVTIDLRPPLAASGKLRAVREDVRSPDIGRHFEGCDAVIHLAFLVASFPGREVFDSVNVGGSQNVFRAAAKAGVKQIIYSSSVAAYGVTHGHPVPIVEDTPRIHVKDFAYSANKYEVEAFLDEFEKEHRDIAIARFRPSILIGARMEHPLGFAFRMRRIPDTGSPFPIVWDEDVADAIILALEKRAHGAFNVAAEDLLPPDKLAAACGMKLFASSTHLLRAWAAISPLLAKVKLSAPMDASWIEKGAAPMVSSSEKARRELGWKPRCPDAISVMKRYLETVPQFVDPRIGAFLTLVGAGARLRPDELDLSGFDSLVHLQVTGPRGGDFGIAVKNHTLKLSRGAPRPPTATVTLTDKLFLELLSGKADFGTAQLTGGIRIEGEGHAAMILNGMITLWRARMGLLKKLPLVGGFAR